MSQKKQARFEMSIGAIDKFSAPFRRFNQRMEESTKGMRRFGAASRTLGHEAGFGKITSSVKGLFGSLGNVRSEALRLTGWVTGLVGKFSLLFGAAGGGFLALAKSTANAGDAAAKSAQRAGVGVKAWQEWAHVASMSDLSAEEMQRSLRKVSDQSIKAATGGKEASLWFRRAGISVRDANGHLKSNELLMMEVADSVKALTDAGQTQKALDLAEGILGKGYGAKLLPMLNSGAAGIREMREEAHELGLVLGENATENSEAFNNALARARGALRGLGFTIGQEFLPLGTELLGQFKEWIVLNRALIQSKVKEWVVGFQAYLPTLKENFFKVTGAVGNLFERVDRFASAIGGWGNFITMLGAIMAGPFLLSILGVAKAFGALGIAMMTTPIGWFLGGIAAIAGGAYLIYKNWEGIKEWFSKLFDFDLFAQGKELIGSFDLGISERWEGLVRGFKDKIKNFTSWMPDWAKEKLGISGPGNDGSGPASAPSVFQGEPLGAAAMGARMQESTVTKVERDEINLNVVLPEGVQAYTSGGKSDNLEISGAYVGVQAW